MKRTLLYLMVLVLTGFSAKGQLTKNWVKSAIVSGTTPVPENGYSWLINAGTQINSCAYNPVTGNLYVANRGVAIYKINPATGEQTGTLNMGSILPNSFGLHKIRVTALGEIFAVTLKTSEGNGLINIYRWASESDVPVLISGSIVLAEERTGDAFGISGSGDGVVIYLGGSRSTTPKGGEKVQVISKVAGSFALSNTVNLATAGSARTGISPVTTGITSDIWISGPTVQKRRISSTGTLVKGLADNPLVAGAYSVSNSISNKFASLEYFEVGTKKYLAAAGANDNPATGEGLAFHIYDVTDLNNVLLVANSKLVNTYNANTGPTSDIAINKVANQDGSFTVKFFQLVNHNGLASYSLNFNADGTLPVSLSSFEASLKNGASTLS